MNVVRRHRRWMNLLYKVVFLLIALVWATDPSHGNLTVFAAVLLLAFAIPSASRNLRRSEHPTALAGGAVTLAVVLSINRTWVMTPLMLAIWAALAVIGTVAWLLRPATPPAEEEREFLVKSAGV